MSNENNQNNENNPLQNPLFNRLLNDIKKQIIKHALYYTFYIIRNYKYNNFINDIRPYLSIANDEQSKNDLTEKFYLKAQEAMRESAYERLTPLNFNIDFSGEIDNAYVITMTLKEQNDKLYQIFLEKNKDFEKNNAFFDFVKEIIQISFNTFKQETLVFNVENEEIKEIFRHDFYYFKRLFYFSAVEETYNNPINYLSFIQNNYVGKVKNSSRLRDELL